MATLQIEGSPATGGGVQRAAAADILVGSNFQSHSATALTINAVATNVLLKVASTTKLTIGTSNCTFVDGIIAPTAGTSLGTQHAFPSGTGALISTDTLPTATTGAASLSATEYDITSNDTYEDVGLSVTLPAAGTYLVIANIREGVQITASPNASLTNKFYNSTDAVDVANSERNGAVATSTGVPFTVSLSMAEVITVAAAKTIKLYVKRNSGPTYTSSFVYTDAGGRSRMTYVRLS